VRYGATGAGARLISNRDSANHQGRSAWLQSPWPRMIPEIDIWRSANELIKEFGDLADIEAAARADAHENKGNLEGQRVWLKILNAVVELQKARPGETKH
jgi:hypothetical protein